MCKACIRTNVQIVSLASPTLRAVRLARFKHQAIILIISGKVEPVWLDYAEEPRDHFGKKTFEIEFSNTGKFAHLSFASIRRGWYIVRNEDIDDERHLEGQRLLGAYDFQEERYVP